MPRLKNIIIFSFLIVFIAISACKKDNNITEIDLGYNYQPIYSGKEIVYDVDSIVYDLFLEDTLEFHYQIKESIDSEFIDNQGDTAFKFIRYKRANTNSNWSLTNVWVIKQTPTSVQRVEDNQRIVVLTFPIKDGNAWNGNVFNNSDEEEFYYSEVNTPFSLNNETFDSTLTVIQKEEVNIIETIISQEVYAKNLGLIYKEVVNLNSQPQDDGSIKTEGLQYYMYFNSSN